MSGQCELYIETIKSELLYNSTQDKCGVVIGDEIFETIYELSLIHEELKGASKSHVVLQIVKEFLRIYTGRASFWIHSDVAKKLLDKKGVSDIEAVELLTKTLLDYCKKIGDSIAYPQKLSTAIRECQVEADSISTKEGHSLEILEFSTDDDELEKVLIKDGLFLWDWCYLKVLSSTGKAGKEAAKQIKSKLQENVKNYLKNKESSLLYGFWFAQPNESNRSCFFSSPAIDILAECLWEDISEKRYALQKKSCPALPKALLSSTLKPFLTSSCRVEGAALFSSEGKAIATIPCMDVTSLQLIKNGMALFSTLTGHKLLRWEVEVGHDNWINQVKDPRLITVPGGYEFLAHLIGCGKSNKVSGEVRALLHAQDYGEFTFPDGSRGSMISHRLLGLHKKNEPTQINIVLGDVLLPHYTHRLPKGDKRRLIPITPLPPLIGAKNTYAAQALLQLLVLEEFSNQSNLLVENGSVYLPASKWEELANNASLPKSRLSVVIDGWASENSERDAFLVRQGDEYTLAPSYAKVMNFLEDQGGQRIKGSRAGRKSAARKKNFAIKGYLRRTHG